MRIAGTETFAPELLEDLAEAGDVAPETAEAALRMSLAGGPDEISPGWWKWGSCRGLDVNEMYPERGEASSHLRDLCAERCAVQAECLSAALTVNEQFGIWGGTSGRGRRLMRRTLRQAGLLAAVGEEAYVAWREPGAERVAEDVAPEREAPAEPWPHQAAAVEAIVEELADGGVCQVAMATASGKTHVGAWAARDLDVDQVVVLAPALSLVAQTARIWDADPAWAGVPMLAVCSDAGDVEGLDATTDPAEVAAFVDEHPRCLIVGTYASSDVLAEAGVEWELVIADEAHHLAGAAGKAHASLVREEIPARRVLYMTATPRQYRRRHGGGSEAVDMTPDGPFGPRVFSLSLSDAVEAGAIADYRVLVAGVEAETFERVASDPELADVDPHLFAGAIAVVEAMGDHRLGSCVSFHSRVERARQFARLVGKVAERLTAERPSGPGWSGYVHGGTSVRIRDRLLARLADERSWGVVANARALGEGVDLPSLDAVAIVDAKSSEVDVLQAAGRALRRPGSKTVGTVLLPVLLTRGAGRGDPLSGADERSLELVAGVLRALSSHDTDLASRLETLRRELAKQSVRSGRGRPGVGQLLRKVSARGLISSRVELQLPEGALSDLAGAVALYVVRDCTDDWDEAYGRLLAWTEEHGHCRIPQSEDLPVYPGAKTTLGQWCSRQRTLRKRGLLAPDRVEALESLPRWMWDARAEAWWEKFDALADFIRVHDRLPLQKERWQGVRVGSFVNTCRSARTDHDGKWLEQFPDRIEALEALPHWRWVGRAEHARWEENFQRLCRYVEEHGHAHPSTGETVDGFNIGRWVTKQRSKIRAGRRTAEQIERLRSLPGWVDDYRDVSTDLWEDGFQRLSAYAGDHGGPPKQDYVSEDGFRLGSWVAKQRQAYRGQRGQLADDQIERLERVPGWFWSRDERPECGDCGRHHQSLHAALTCDEKNGIRVAS